MSIIVTRQGKGSALTWVEGDANFTNLNSDKLENLIDDTNPQLGGNLDVLTRSITSSIPNGNISVVPNGVGRVIIGLTAMPLDVGLIGQVLTTDGAGTASWVNAGGGGGGAAHSETFNPFLLAGM